MSTRATYQFKNNGWSGLDTTVYIHHDGYPEGAALYFKAASESGRAGVEGFIAANQKAEITASHEIHGDTEFRYTSHKGQLTALKRIDYTDVWEVFYKGTISDFIAVYLGELAA
tara:strand:+ start:176 stop:517 length:342 start_codon:yes stop_codon:yes gene_type:complete